MGMEVIRELGERELLCQLAEEASELAQAALKLRRAIDGANPTPKTELQCWEALYEEIADVELVIEALDLNEPDFIETQSVLMAFKEARWTKRLLEAQKSMPVDRLNKEAETWQS